MASPKAGSPKAQSPTAISPRSAESRIEPEQTQIAVDEDLDTTSDYGASLDSELTSLKSSVMDYVFENGRRYHAYKSGKYILPNDEAEQDRLDLHHHIFLLALHGELTTAPTSQGIQHILDVGTGTGIWAIDAADTFPSAEVIGTDLSPIQPSWVPPNCRFDIDDAEQEWLWAPDYFDFIHSRNLTQSIRNWPRYTEQIFQHTKPGGHVELVELEPWIRCDDGSLPEKSRLIELLEVWAEGAKKMELPQPNASDLQGYLADAGFTDITLRSIKLPYGLWPKDKTLKEIGKAQMLLGQNYFHSYSTAMHTRVLGWTIERSKSLCDDARDELLNKKHHTYQIAWHIVAGKPVQDN